MQLYLHNITPCQTTSLVRLITTFACITLPECSAGFCMGVQHSCPNLLLISLNYNNFINYCDKPKCFYYVLLILLADSPEAPILQLVTNNTNFNYLSLLPPPNSYRVDIDFYNATATGSSFNETYNIILSKYTSKFMLPSLYRYQSQNITLEVVAVDRCHQQSPAAMVSIPGK